MSLSNQILSLISGITDPAVRMDIASTIRYLYDVFCSGKVSDDEIKNSLYEICKDVITATKPDLLPDEASNLAKAKAEELLKAFRIESLSRRVQVRFKGSPI